MTPSDKIATYYQSCGSKALVEIDPRYFLPAEVGALLGDASTGRVWVDARASFVKLVAGMMGEDLKDSQTC
ncbi:MAG TPA: hypothetical protein VIK28_10575 [Sedimentisphaerales bacterium]